MLLLLLLTTVVAVFGAASISSSFEIEKLNEFSYHCRSAVAAAGYAAFYCSA